MRLEPHDPGCELHYTVNAQVGGRIAQVGQRLIDGVARSMAEDFFKRFDAEMQRRHPAPVDAAPAGASGPIPAPATPAANDAARGGVPAWAWVLGAVVVVAVGWWLLR